MQNRKRHSRKQLFCEENASVYGIHVHQFSAMFTWNNTSQLLSFTTKLNPSCSGFPSKVDAFSKHDYFFKMVNACICPAIGFCQSAVRYKNISFSTALLTLLLATWRLSFRIAPLFCLMAAPAQKSLAREWGEWELGIQKVTQMSWGNEEWRGEGRRSKRTEGGRKCSIFAI